MSDRFGGAIQADVLRIEWASGTVQELENSPAKQILTITEPARLAPLRLREFQIPCWKEKPQTPVCGYEGQDSA